MKIHKKAMKFLPITFSLIFSIATILYFVGVEKIDLSARLSEQETKQLVHFENTFKEISFEDLEGKNYELSKVESPVVILNFWASWCVPCLDEFPSLVRLREHFSKDQVSIFGINSDEEDQEKKISKTVEKFNLNFDIIPDKDSRLLNEFMVSAIPVTIIFVKGKPIEVSLGRKDFYSAEFIEKIESAL